ncbi:hypothetical protein ACFQAV_11550 [Companilactobacillus huachuanensis]|uniref:SCP domain-containing protein n=1 Tax=Companilactobacillus huachuanensis TaxID=2559914 RepID=A0ABW1RPY0_9LACO|nr:hypothetical protein [Companilactobacillus huachuanensis]
MKTVKNLIVGMALLASATGAMLFSQKDADAAKVASVNDNVARLYREDGKLITDRALGPNSNWLVGRIFTHNGDTYYQVATKEYLKANTAKRLYDNTNPSLNYTPNIQRINQYFIKYLNALHAANGTPMTTTTADMFEYANHRAYQQVGDTMDHSTRPRETEENLYGFGYDYILKWGQRVNMTSDRDVAFYLLKEWYDDDINLCATAGQVGHFGHRAALIYTGTPAAIGMADNSIALSAEWTTDYDGFMSIYNYTGSNPNTKFISKDVVPE